MPATRTLNTARLADTARAMGGLNAPVSPDYAALLAGKAPAPVAIDALSETEFLSVFDLADEFDISEDEMIAAAAHFAADC